MKPKTIKTVYWISTILFAAFMTFSGISELLATEQGSQILISLGYPLYLNTILGVAKLLGAFAILYPKFRTLKEWAYAGFTFDTVGASASHLLNGDGISVALFPLAFLALMLVSYFSWKKIQKK